MRPYHRQRVSQKNIDKANESVQLLLAGAMKVARLKAQIERGEYAVGSDAVAEAMLANEAVGLFETLDGEIERLTNENHR